MILTQTSSLDFDTNTEQFGHHHLILTQTSSLDFDTNTERFGHRHLILTQTSSLDFDTNTKWFGHRHLILTQTSSLDFDTNTEQSSHRHLILTQISSLDFDKHWMIWPPLPDFKTNTEHFGHRHLILTQNGRILPSLPDSDTKCTLPLLLSALSTTVYGKKGMLKPYSAPHHKHFVLRLTSTLATPRSPCVTANQHAGNTMQPLCYS